MKVVEVPAEVLNDGLPWECGEDAFCTWVWEVFLVGYAHTIETLWGPHEVIPIPSLTEAVSIVRAAGYTVEIEGSTLTP